jgi:hypothetical protein
MECVASDYFWVVWGGFYYGAVFEANSGFLDMAASLGKVAAKTRYSPKIQFGLAKTWTYGSYIQVRVLAGILQKQPTD